MLMLPAIASGAPLLNVIHHCDALTLLPALPDASVDCVVTSPPYNLRNSSGNGLKGQNDKSLWTNQAMQHGYDEHCSDDMPHDEYIEWQHSVLVECLRIIKPAGVIFYNHKWRVQEGLLQRLADEITAGLPVRQIIIWNRGNGFNFNSGYFLPVYEVIYMVAGAGFELQPRTNTMKDVWSIAPEENKDHPNAFPVELAERCVLAGTKPGGTVLDPFMGSGTTALAAKQTGRNYIGCDLSLKYIEQARARLAQPYTLSMFDRVEKPAAPEQLSMFAGVSL